MLSLGAVVAFLAPIVGFKPADKPDVVVPVEPPAPQTMAHFIAWLGSKPANEKYEWSDLGFGASKGCLHIQYAKHVGGEKNFLRPYTVYFPPGSNVVDFETKIALAIGEERTFGAALKRAKAYHRAHPELV